MAYLCAPPLLRIETASCRFHFHRSLRSSPESLQLPPSVAVLSVNPTDVTADRPTGLLWTLWTLWMARRQLTLVRVDVRGSFRHLEILRHRNLAVLDYLIDALLHRFVLQLIGHLLANLGIGRGKLTDILDPDNMKAELSFNQPACLTGLQREGGRLKRGNHLAPREVAKIPTAGLGAGVVRIVLGERGEVFPL